MPRLLIDEPDWRVVEDLVGENEIHTLEVKDGKDAMGVQKWKVFVSTQPSMKSYSKELVMIFGYLVRLAHQLEQTKHE
jgi:hypothetical protein